MLCEQLEQEPDPTKMPLELSEFPEEVQVAFFMCSLLPENYEGTSGTYMGKYWDGIDYYFKLYEVHNRKVVLYIMKMYETLLISSKAQKSERQRKTAEQRAKSGGKSYTHNIQG